MTDLYDDYYPEAGPRRLRVPLIICVAILLLRLAVGWHFYSEGTEKLAVDSQSGEVTIAFRGTEGFLRGAVGPIADLARGQLPGFHDWQELLAQPRQFTPPTSEQRQERAAWQREYEASRTTTEEKNKTLAQIDEPLKPMPIEFPPSAPYKDLAERIASDWAEAQNEFANLGGLTNEQRAASADAYQAHKQLLADYFTTIEDEVVEWQHELWRLQQWQNKPGAEEIPFRETRIAEMSAETGRTPLPWIAQLRTIEQSYFDQLRGIVADEEAESASLVNRVDSLLDDDKARRLHYADVGVTFLTFGVGVCLMLGLFTRLASVFGALFLVAVMATQPPWVEGAMTEYFYYQLVEFAALAVLFATAAGRIAGLDYILHAIFGKGGSRKEA